MAGSPTGVVSGCAVTVSGFTITVAAGVVAFNGANVAVAQQTATIPAPSTTTDRFDIVGVALNGIIGYSLGWSTQSMPVVSDGAHIPLSSVHVIKGAGAVFQRNLADLRVLTAAADAVLQPGNMEVAGGLTVDQHLSRGSSAAAPTAAAGANAGSSPPAPVLSTAARDMAGMVTFGSGTGPAAGDQVDVTFATPYGVVPVIVLTAMNDATAVLQLFISARSTSGFNVSTHGAPAATQGNTIYSLVWIAIG